MPDEGAIRLVFIGRHRIRFIGSIERAPFAAESTPLALRGARHSVRGMVTEALREEEGGQTLVAPGDTVTFDFVATPRAGETVRDWLLVTRGVYSSVRPPDGRDLPAERPLRFGLWQNQPNPFSSSTAIRFDLPDAVPVKLEIFDLQGRRVRALIEGPFPAGVHTAIWNHRDDNGRFVRPGLYMYRLRAGAFQAVRKTVLLP